jgi:hypothetical protein
MEAPPHGRDADRKTGGPRYVLVVDLVHGLFASLTVQHHAVSTTPALGAPPLLI